MGRRNRFVAEVVRLPTFRELVARILTNSATTFLVRLPIFCGWLTWSLLLVWGAPLVLGAEAAATAEPRLAKSPEPAPTSAPVGDLTTLRLAMEDLIGSFGPQYPAGREYLARLCSIENQLATTDPQARAVGQAAFRQLQREALLANPLVRGQPILYVARHQYRPDHHNTETIFVVGQTNCANYTPGGALKLLDLTTGRTSVLVDPGPEGVVRDPEVSWDGAKIIFAMRRSRQENYHLYEVSREGAALRQLTSAPDATDIDPLYLPDGSIAFSSTREPKFCMCNMHIMANLYRMDADGANIHQISKNTLFDGHPVLLPDGRILYDRWEYVDRDYGSCQGLWTMNPDGTQPASYWAHNTASPGVVLDARPIPGTERVVCVFSACHDRPWGALAVVDRQRGLDASKTHLDPVIRLWPPTATALIDRADFDAFRAVTPKYEDPYPLGDGRTPAATGKYFLVSRSIDGLPQDNPQEPRLGIWLVDLFGNEVLLHAETLGCFDPQPLRPRDRPPVIPERRSFADESGRLFVLDVYQGTHLQGVRRGAAAALRVVESIEKRFWTDAIWGVAMNYREGSTFSRPAVGWGTLECKQILGTVPVEPDGSAYFEVPADRFVYFQLLDAQGKMITSMRSGTVVQPGETSGCVGCHEHRLQASATVGRRTPLALQRPPSRLDGWYGPVRPFNYVAEVQPIWDRHCVRCHDFNKEESHGLVLARDKDLVFNASYQSLLRGWPQTAQVSPIGNGPPQLLNAYSWGSHRSRLVKLLEEGHEDVQLSREELDRILTWIDVSAPYYPDYGCAYPHNLGGRSPLDNQQLAKLGERTGIDILKTAQHSRSCETLISFDRPALSPCLKTLDKSSAAYREALEIITAGAEALKKNPEAGAPGFRYCGDHARYDEVSQRLRRDELTRRKAIAEGRRVFDGDGQ
ncbi:MAG: hypothetical protein NTY19_48185 [Planctomycetota bacterium]|nr:hypothetical protein [Planctomycetota bacterium]